MSQQRMHKEHENFEISETQTTRVKVLRQDRIDMEPGQFFLHLGKMQFEVVNISAFGIAVTIDEAQLPKGDIPKEFLGAKLTHKDLELQDLHLREVRRLTKPSGWTEFAYEVIGEPVRIEFIHGLEAASQVIRKQKEEQTNEHLVPENFRRHVYEIKDWLESFKTKVAEFELTISNEDARSRAVFEQGFMALTSKFLKESFPTKHSEIGQAIKGLTAEQYKASAEFFRKQLKHLIYDAPFSKRAFEKPKGYAGDYEMMNHLYRDEFVGPHLFAKCLHNYFINEPAGQAVRNRAFYLKKKLSEKFAATPKTTPLKFLSVASGPAREVQLFLETPFAKEGRKAEFVCLDQDEDSLKFAQRSIRTVDREIQSGFGFRFVNKAIKNVIGKGLDETEFDVIYSAGLFDYLSEPVAQMAATRLFNSLKPGGSLIIGNFNLFNPTLPLMDLAWDWHLIYRSPEDLAKMFAPVGGSITVEQEDLGINLFCVIRKPE